LDALHEINQDLVDHQMPVFMVDAFEVVESKISKENGLP